MKQQLQRVLAATVAGFAVSSAFAGMTPVGQRLVAIGEGQATSWSDAVGSGLLRAVSPATDGIAPTEADFYASQGGTTAFVASEVTPNIPVTFGGVTHDSLVMQWNPLMQGEDRAAAAWQYIIPPQAGRSQGIDFWNASIHFSFGAPVNPDGGTPIWDVTISLMDKNGGWGTWALSMPQPGWSFYWINFMQGTQDGWSYFETPGFDLTNIVKIRFGESGRITTFPTPPGGLPPFWDWNAWDSVVIVPAPGATALFMGALVTTVSRRRRAA